MLILNHRDTGFHLGNHRVPGGKGLPYIEDVNLPMAVRGPGISPGKVSKIPSTHVDIAPTILEIAGVPRKDWPPFFDGRSLLKEWQSRSAPNDDISHEVLNVEYWGSSNAPAGRFTKRHMNNSYKSLRIVDEKQGWLFNRWCTSNQTELYNTIEDPYELTNLALNPTPETQRLMDRISGLLLVTKSCGQDSCRKPWEVLSSNVPGTADFTSLDQAMSLTYDGFFASLPAFGFQMCLPYQLVENEGPYWPPSSAELGHQYREDTTHYTFWLTNGTGVAGTLSLHGNLTQRYMSLLDVYQGARNLTDAEIGWPTRKCSAPEYCGLVNAEDG